MKIRNLSEEMNGVNGVNGVNGTGAPTSSDESEDSKDPKDLTDSKEKGADSGSEQETKGTEPAEDVFYVHDTGLTIKIVAPGAEPFEIQVAVRFTHNFTISLKPCTHNFFVSLLGLEQ